MSPPPISRRALGLLCASTVFAATDAMAIWGPMDTPSGGTPIAIATGPHSAFMFRHLPLNIAQQLDFFTPEGLAVTVQAYGSDALALQALRAGAADVCAVNFEQILRVPTERAAALQCFVLQSRSPQMALGVAPRWLPHFKSLADLRGRRLGVPELGSLSHATACVALSQAGVAPNEVSFVPVGEGASALAAVRGGRVHAVCHGDPVMARLEQRGTVRIVVEARTLQGAQALLGGSLPGGCLVAPAAFLQKRAPQAQALANGIVRALKWLQIASPADLVKTLPTSALGNERNLYLSAFARARETLSPDGMMPVDGPATALRVVSQVQPQLVAALGTGVARSFTDDFARKVKIKFSA